MSSDVVTGPTAAPPGTHTNHSSMLASLRPSRASLWYGRSAAMVDRDLAQRFIVLTGANTGIGRATALHLAERGATLVLACRSEEKTRPVLDAIRALGAGEAQFVPLDLSNLDSVRACGARIDAMGRPIDVLLDNAGVAGARGATKQGFELAFGTNHVGHFLLTMLLVPRLRAAKNARIVIVASRAHYDAKGIDFEAVRRRPNRSPGYPSTPCPSSPTCSSRVASPSASVRAASTATRCTPASSRPTHGVACRGHSGP